MHHRLLSCAVLLLIALPSYAQRQAAATTEKPAAAASTTSTAKKGTPAEAKAFVAKANADLKKLWRESARADWVKNTYITDDTEVLSAEASEKVMAYLTVAIKEAARFDGVAGIDPDTRRMLDLLKLAADLPSPSDAAKTTELASIASKMTGLYGKGKVCDEWSKKSKFDASKDGCLDLPELGKLMSESRDVADLDRAWLGWHSIAPPIRPLYQRYVELVNEGSREIGFANVATLWKARYDMPPDAFEADMERLWTQVKPLYQDLHCYVRAKLADKYKGKIDPTGTIPANLLGNMWAQEWGNVYPLVEPNKGQASLDVTAALVKKKYDATKMVKLGEGFFTSLGLKPLPETFYQRSMFLKPKDRDVVCHASAWDVTYENDVRIKMCIDVDEENLVTIHHELGHIYYYQYYHTLPVLYQQGANDGFHEAIGDAIALSVNPEYLVKVGVLDKAPANNDKALINVQMKDALDKIAFLPFGYLMDKWRWDVFSGKTKPDQYNARWWELRRKYQGIDAPGGTRDEASFDPGAKYHIPANVPYARYFIARVLQFQLHRSLCKAAGHTGPLHTCSIYGSKDAGARMQKLLELGASRPWPEALKVATGETQLDATAILDYFAPLQAWLKTQNAGKQCGWPGQ
jgi:peptidyl-dipeptidase A